MKRMFEKTRLEYIRSAKSNHLDYSGPMKVRRGREQTPPSSPQADQPRFSGTLDTGHSGRKHSVVKQLCDRAGAEESSIDNQLPVGSVSNGQPREASISEVLARINPNHNKHLRRSTRTITESKRPSVSLFDAAIDEPIIERYSKTHDLGEPWKKPLTYPKMGKKKITVEFSDLERLDEGEFLNDNLLSFYLRFLEHTLEEERPCLAKRVYFFNTFFFATLMNTHKGKKGFNYEGVQKWTRNVDLFTYDYIVVPINEATHWYLAIICNMPALDRNLSFEDEGACSQAKSAPVLEVKGTMEHQQSSLSPSGDALGDGSFDRAEDRHEPDENGTRRSFEVMTLDAIPQSPPANHVTYHDSQKPRTGGSKNEDEEMLDVPSHDALSLPKENGRKSDSDYVRGNDENTIEGQCETPQTAGRSKKGKRKSGPPPVTKTCPDKPVIITFDSLGLPRSSTIRILKDYLREEAKAKRGGMEFEPGDIKGITATHIPQQDNYYDCGVFLLGYVAKFLEDDPKEFIAKIIKREYDETKDWPKLKPSLLRSNIRDQVLKLHNDQVAERFHEKDAQKHGKQAQKQDVKYPSSPARPEDSMTIVSQKAHQIMDEVAEEVPRAPFSAGSTTQDESNRNKRDSGGQDIEKLIASMFPTSEGTEDTAQLSELAKADLHDQEVHPSEMDEAVPKKKIQMVPNPFDDESSVILVESQSQQNISAPKSFTDSHPAPEPTRKSLELPAEIQDSQPSQTLQTFTKVLSESAKKDAPSVSEHEKLFSGSPIGKMEDPRATSRRKVREEAAARTKKVSIKDPVPVSQQEEISQHVPTEDPRAAKRRKVQEENAAAAEAQKVIGEHDVDFTSWAQPAASPIRRRKKAWTIQTNDEVINIDD